MGKGYEIGHSYFIPDGDPQNANSIINDEWVKLVAEYEIAPLIKEYWFDDEKKANEELKALFNAVGEDYDGS